jgi:imidazolonepropionase-like amidohydrolase
MAFRSLLAGAGALPLAIAVSIAQQPNLGGAMAATAADYALTNVRIVTAPGKVIERGTVLTRDGRIAAVGASVNVPAGVVKLDLAGHTVFPGLIDAATSIGLPSPTRPPAGVAASGVAAAGRGGRGGNVPPGVNGRGGGGAGTPAPPVVLPEVDAGAEAADMFAPTEDQLKAFRAGGVTTVGLVFNGGLFPGRVGAALTGSRDGGRLALRTSAAQQVSFGTKRDGYPATGIGAVAYIRQAYIDAQYEARLDKAMRAGTPGARPSNDPFDRALMAAATNEMPSWFVASTEREMTRVAEIAKEMGIRGPVIVGAREGYRSIPTLKAAAATAVVSLEWPSADSVTGHAFLLHGIGKSETATIVDPAATAVKANGATLVKAGVPVALASFGGVGGATFRDRVRETIAAGMSPDDALRATTVTPAAILGITSTVGTIEVGKLANLVVVNGNDLFASGTPITHVFVEGRLY